MYDLPNEARDYLRALLSQVEKADAAYRAAVNAAAKAIGCPDGATMRPDMSGFDPKECD